MPRISVDPDEEYPFYRADVVDGDRHGIEISDAEWAEIEQGYEAYYKLRDKLEALHRRIVAAEPLSDLDYRALVTACRASAAQLRRDFEFDIRDADLAPTPSELRDLIIAYPDQFPGPTDGLQERLKRSVVVERDAEDPDVLLVLADRTPVVRVRIERLVAPGGPEIVVTTRTLGPWHGDPNWTDAATEYTRQLAERALIRLLNRDPADTRPTLSAFRAELLDVVHSVDPRGDFADRMDREVEVTLDPAAPGGVSVTRRQWDAGA